jgi:hypothetical protein
LDGVLFAEVVGAELQAEHTQKGQSWRVELTPRDSLQAGPAGWAEAEIQNTPPSTPQLIMAANNGPPPWCVYWRGESPTQTQMP